MSIDYNDRNAYTPSDNVKAKLEAVMVAREELRLALNSEVVGFLKACTDRTTFLLDNGYGDSVGYAKHLRSIAFRHRLLNKLTEELVPCTWTEDIRRALFEYDNRGTIDTETIRRRSPHPVISEKEVEE